MTLAEIKAAVEAGKTVCWKNAGYKVVKDRIGQWLVVCTWNGFCVGLTQTSGAMNEQPEDFYVAEAR